MQNTGVLKRIQHDDRVNSSLSIFICSPTWLNSAVLDVFSLNSSNYAVPITFLYYELLKVLSTDMRKDFLKAFFNGKKFWKAGREFLWVTLITSLLAFTLASCYFEHLSTLCTCWIFLLSFLWCTLNKQWDIWDQSPT